MSHKLRFVALGLALAAPGLAQLSPDTWVATTVDNFITSTGGGGIHLVSADRTTYTSPTGQTANMPGANAAVADGLGFLFYGTINSSSIGIPNPGEIFMVIISGGTVASETRLTATAPDNSSISGLTLRGDQLWYVTGNGNVGWIPLPSASNPPPYAPNNVFNINIQGGIAGSGQSITTDGREIFIGIAFNPGSADPFTIWAFDAEDPNPTLRGVALPYTGSVFDMSMDRDGNIFAGVIGGRLFSVDPVTGSSVQLSGSAPQNNANGASLNPWDNVAGVVAGFGSSPRQLDHFDLNSGTFFSSPVGILGSGIPSNVTSASEQPFQLFGSGCPGANLLEPRMRWQGMPIGGQSFNLTMRDADPNAFALIVFGFSDQVSAFGLLPFDLGLIGAPGCSLWISTDSSSLVAVDSGGNATFPIPVPASLGAFELFAEWAVLTAVNALGAVSTEAVRIRTR